MDQMAELPVDARNAVEIVVYIRNHLGDEQRGHVVSTLEKIDGIIGAEFCPLRNHLVLARYNKNIFSSQDVLKSFNALNLEARLIGPI